MAKQKKVKTNVEIFMGMRRDWGNVNPVTRVIPDKRFKKPKYKKGWDEQWKVLSIMSTATAHQFGNLMTASRHFAMRVRLSIPEWKCTSLA